MSTEATLRTNRAVATNGIDWVPYLAGIGIGVLSWLVFVVVATPIGVTTAASQVAGGVAAFVVGQEAVQANPYWARNPLHLDYGTLGKITLSDVTGLPVLLIYALLAALALVFFRFLEARRIVG